MDTRKLWVPEKFWDDHVYRECDLKWDTQEIRRAGKRVLLSICDDALADLEGDADYYASFDGSDFQDNRGLVLSARATLRAIAKQTA